MLGARYQTKKELRTRIGHKLKYVETSLSEPEYTDNGVLCVCGPDPYRKRSWFAEVTMENGLIKKVS